MPEATQKMEGTCPGQQSPRCYSCQSPASGPPAWAACPGEEKNRKPPRSVASPTACPCPGVQPATDPLGYLSSEQVFLCIAWCTGLLFRGPQYLSALGAALLGCGHAEGKHHQVTHSLFLKLSPQVERAQLGKQGLDYSSSRD